MLEDFREIQPEFYMKVERSIIQNHRVSHAYFIETNRFAQSRSLVLALAKLLLCPEALEHSSLQQCKICHLIEENQYPDLRVIEPDGSGIKKEQLLSLQQQFRTKSLTGGRRVYIIFQADRLNVSSANTILKFLEEPEENIVAILVADHRYQVLPTILSRCQVLSLRESTDVVSSEEIQNLASFLQLCYNKGQHILAYLNATWYTFCKEKDDYKRYFLVLENLYIDLLHHYGDYVFFQKKYGQAFEYVDAHDDLNAILAKIQIIHRYRDDLKYNLNLKLWLDAFLIQWMEV